MINNFWYIISCHLEKTFPFYAFLNGDVENGCEVTFSGSGKIFAYQMDANYKN